jgi:membrane-associated phospholipid phosphatase
MVKKAEEEKLKLELKFDYHSSRFFALLFPAIYLVAIGIFSVEYNIIPGPEFIILAFLIYAAYNQRTWRFLKDWLPLITVFTSYEIMYGVVGAVAQTLHMGPYNFDLSLFGQIPSIILQNSIRSPILDTMGAVFYSLHFFAPVIFAYVLWRASPKNYWKYTIALGLCTYGALVTFLFYPVAPPWIEVPGVTRVLTQSVDVSLGVPVYKTLFDFLGGNLYAAFPSMHSALPFLISLFAIKIWKLKATPILIFPVGVWFSAVYLGEHYVIDVVGGILYALAAFLVVEKVLPLLSSRFAFLRKHIPCAMTETAEENGQLEKKQTDDHHQAKKCQPK